jgi:hypothetical protein
MLQYGKPINKNSKSTDLKIKFGCLGCSNGGLRLARLFAHLSGGGVVFVAEA